MVAPQSSLFRATIARPLSTVTRLIYRPYIARVTHRCYLNTFSGSILIMRSLVRSEERRFLDNFLLEYSIRIRNSAPRLLQSIYLTMTILDVLFLPYYDWLELVSRISGLRYYCLPITVYLFDHSILILSTNALF